MLILKTKGSSILFLRKSKAQRLGKIVHKQNPTNANLTCPTSNKEAKVRKQPEKVMRSVINVLQCRGENLFLDIFKLRFSAFQLKQGVEGFLLGEDQLVHGTEIFQPLEKTCKERCIKPAKRFSFALWSSSSIQL